jgi:glucans biosynthesis protein
MKLEANPMQSELPMHLSPRCQAQTRQKQPCRSPAVRGKRVCRMHGGSSPGAPQGAANGAWKDGAWSNDAVASMRAVGRLLRAIRPES